MTFFANCYSKGDVNAKTSITDKRRLSADLTLQRAHLGLKNREGLYNYCL